MGQVVLVCIALSLSACFLENNETAIIIDASQNMILRSNVFSVQQNNLIDVRPASSNTRIENTTEAAIRLSDAESAVQIIDSEGYLIHASNNLPNQIQGGVISINLDFVDSTRITVIHRLNMSVSTSGTFTFTPTIWDAENFNIIAWEIEAAEVSTGYFTIASLENGSEYNLLINGTNWNTFVVSEQGIITFDYPGIQNNIFALVKVGNSG